MRRLRARTVCTILVHRLELWLECTNLAVTAAAVEPWHAGMRSEHARAVYMRTEPRLRPGDAHTRMIRSARAGGVRHYEARAGSGVQVGTG